MFIEATGLYLLALFLGILIADKTFILFFYAIINAFAILKLTFFLFFWIGYAITVILLRGFDEFVKKPEVTKIFLFIAMILFGVIYGTNLRESFLGITG
jgi:hypothetical protein